MPSVAAAPRRSSPSLPGFAGLWSGHRGAGTARSRRSQSARRDKAAFGMEVQSVSLRRRTRNCPVLAVPSSRRLVAAMLRRVLSPTLAHRLL